MSESQAAPLLVVGAGAVGGYIAAHLARMGTPIVVFEPWAPNREAIAARGMTVLEPSGTFTVPLRTIGSAGEIPQVAPRMVVLCTKLADAPAALAEIESVYRGDYLVTLNALADLDVAEQLGPSRVAGCIVTGLFANLIEPGRMQRHRTRDDGGPATFLIGETAGPATPRVRDLTALFEGIDTTKAVDDMPAARWTKMVFNCMTSPLSAVLGQPIRALFLDAGPRAEMTELALEVVRIAMACGVTLEAACGIPGATWMQATSGDAAALATVEAGLLRYGEKMNATAVSGMAQDLARGRRTEAWLINGAVVTQAQRRGLEAPANAALIARIDAAMR